MQGNDASEKLKALKEAHEASLVESRKAAGSTLYKPGNMVWCNFPYDADPRAPGPERHACIYMRTLRSPSGEERLQMMYTSSKPNQMAEMDANYRIRVGKTEALGAGNERAFLIFADRIAYLPATRAFFPDLRPEMKASGYGLMGHAAPGILVPAVNAYTKLLKEDPGPNRTLRIYGPESTLAPQAPRQSQPAPTKKTGRDGWER